MSYRNGECIGRALCDQFEEAPSSFDNISSWPKQMRNRNEYAGSRDRDYKYQYPKEPSMKKRFYSYGKKINYNRKSVQKAGSANSLVRLFSNEFIIWISAEKIDDKYCPLVLLQYKDSFRFIHEKDTFDSRRRAMLRGLIISAGRVKKPSNIYIIADTILFTNMYTNYAAPDDDMLSKVVDIFAKKGCEITEVRFEMGQEIIYKHIRDHSNS